MGKGCESGSGPGDSHLSPYILAALVAASFAVLPHAPAFCSTHGSFKRRDYYEKQLIAAFACTAALSLYGCSSQPQATETPASESLQSEAATETPVDTSADSSEAESADGTSIDGVIIDAP